MARLSDIIEEFIKTLLKESEGELELQRNDLASYFDCAPSQINYVLATRFTLNHGYYIESRRGGGGYIRIVRLDTDKDDYLFYLLKEGIGKELSEQEAVKHLQRMVEQGFISKRDAYIINSAISDKAIAIPSTLKDGIRARIFKSILAALLSLDEKK
ncbi:MAG TPA: CtsR family transcriptional regulator [Candidatus Atribacteria bacterium]|mgnify:FL=1|nr:CtsR family transcriptional regulator [Candidatus Atribacteria bacterium]